MVRARHVVTVGCLLSAVSLSCTAPTEPSAEAARFAALLSAPAWTLGAARDSAFAAQLRYHRENSGFFNGGWRAARSPERWTALWDTVVVSRVPPPAPLVVDFSQEMVVLAAHGATASGGHAIDIVHVTRQRDTTFVLTRIHQAGRDCGTTSAGTSPIDARVVPLAPPPTWFLVELNVLDCRTGRSRPVW